MKKIAFFIVLISLISLYSCRKDRFEPNTPGSMEELKVPANFDWKTTKDYILNLSATDGGLIEVTNNNGVTYQRAFLSAGTPYAMMLTLPAQAKSVTLKFKGKIAELNLAGSNLSYHFN